MAHQSEIAMPKTHSLASHQQVFHAVHSYCLSTSVPPLLLHHVTLHFKAVFVCYYLLMCLFSAL